MGNDVFFSKWWPFYWILPDYLSFFQKINCFYYFSENSGIFRLCLYNSSFSFPSKHRLLIFLHWKYHFFNLFPHRNFFSFCFSILSRQWLYLHLSTGSVSCLFLLKQDLFFISPQTKVSFLPQTPADINLSPNSCRILNLTRQLLFPFSLIYRPCLIFISPKTTSVVYFSPDNSLVLFYHRLELSLNYHQPTAALKVSPNNFCFITSLETTVIFSKLPLLSLSFS